MTICGVIVWYDETAAWLSSAVAGFARLCDHIVAVDGAYALYPAGRPRSHPDQSEAILDACEAAGVGCVVHRPSSVWWGNEVEKRNFSLQLARPLLTPGEDWVLIFDSDYQVMRLDDPAFIRGLVRETDRNVMTYTLLDTQEAGLLEDAHDLPTDWTYKDRGLFRWTDDLEYVGCHYFMRGTYQGEQQWVRGPELTDTGTGLVEAGDLGSSMVVLHRRSRRPRARNDAAHGFAMMRDRHGAEAVPATVAT